MGRVLRGNQHVPALRLREARIKHDGGKRGENPWPRTQRIVREIEPQNGEQSVAFIARAEYPLGNVTAAARLRAGIPEGPPLHCQMHDERDDGKSPQSFASETARKIGEQRGDVAGVGTGEFALRGEFCEELRHSANSVDAIPGNRDHDGHFQNELEQVRPKHAPQTAERNVNSRERHQEENANRQRLRVADTQRSADDAGHRFGNPAKNEAIHQQA